MNTYYRALQTDINRFLIVFDINDEAPPAWLMPASTVVLKDNTDPALASARA